MKELSLIQTQLKAPKGQTNTFGKYKYRSCEDILEALKPLLAEHKCALTLSDTITAIEGRVYVQATATLANSEGVTNQVTAFAREAESKKGMDEAQITGSASSYARKYALNGLFAIDDTKDADATNDHGKGQPEAKKPVPDKERCEKFNKAMWGVADAYDEAGKADLFAKLLKDHGYEIIEDIKDVEEQKTLYSLATSKFKLIKDATA